MVQTFIRLAVETSSTRVCASDGSSKEEVGAWAVAFEQQAPLLQGLRARTSPPSWQSFMD